MYYRGLKRDSRVSYAKRGTVLDTHGEGDPIDIKEGDIINLPILLFTENRDYLVKNNGQKVKAEQLVAKAILLYFVPVCLDSNCVMEKTWTTFLIDIYNDLLPKSDFEVIFVAVDDVCSESFLASGRDPQKNFDSLFARMPWTAIPFSDLGSRKRIAKKLGVLGGEFFCGVRGKLRVSCSVSLDSKGMVLKRNACYLFGGYGTPGYPFTDERIKFLNFEDDAIAKNPSLESLLGSRERDYVISNKGDRVPIHTLKDKVVALYFYEDGLTNYRRPQLTPQLEMAYKELKNKENFEVVLLYLYDTCGTLHCTNEESFWNTLKTMPWLALPFKDSSHKKLKRIFGYPDDLDGPELAPTLVIVGPNGEFVDPCGADVLKEFGTSAYPFTRRKVANLKTEMVKELKLEMLWDPNTVFGVKYDGLEIPFSQFAGKRVLIYFEMNGLYRRAHWERLLKMKDLYLKMKGTDDEFEVIYKKDSLSSIKPYGDWIPPDYNELPWSAHYYDAGYSLPKELEQRIFDFNCSSGRKGSRLCFLVAFERDGSLVRRTFHPTFNDVDFPFFAGGLKEEYLDQLDYYYGWLYWNYMEERMHSMIYQRR
ncbi:hypothetical protein AgCh_006635 [Apium graveolens]